MIETNAVEHFDSTSTQLDLEPLVDENALVVWMRPPGRSCFTLDLLSALSEVTVATQAGRFGNYDHWVLGSRVPDVFNYGGDLELFADAIRSRDRRLLRGYGQLCVDLVYQHRTGFGLPITTTSLIEGDALGGGAEAALSAQTVVAERGRKIGFPEIMFNLFPGMGALHLLADRVGVVEAERMLLEGRFHSTDDFHELGLIDVLADPGEGLAATRDHLARLRANGNGRRGLRATRNEISSLSYEALTRTVERWVDRALELGDDNLALVDHLVGRQHAKADG